MPAPTLERVHKVARSATGEPQAQLHIPALDGVRGIAIVAVVGFHLAVLASTNAPWAYRGSPPLYSWPLFAGSLGVDVFFVLSGLLVYRSWQTLRARYQQDGVRTIVEFARRRARRLLPPYWLALAVLVPWRAPEWLQSIDGWRNIAMFASLNQFVDTDLPGALSTVTWSLTTETHFYFVLPILALALARFGWRAMLPVLVVTSISWRLASGGTGGEAEWIGGRIDQFAAGMAAAALIADHQMHRSSAMLRILTGRRAGVLLGGSLVLLATLHGALRLMPKPLIFLATLHTLVGLVTAGLLVRVLCLGKMRALRNRVLVGSGLVSYSLYLWHWPVLAEAVARWGPRPPVLAGSLAVGLAVSLLSYVLLERPFLRPAQLSPRARRALTEGPGELQPRL